MGHNLKGVKEKARNRKKEQLDRRRDKLKKKIVTGPKRKEKKKFKNIKRRENFVYQVKCHLKKT